MTNCFKLKASEHAHATYSDFFTAVKMTILKNDNFQLKFFDYFHIFAQNIDRGYTLERF